MKVSKSLGYDLLITTGLGLLSFLLGYIKFQLPGMVGASTDLREIPLLIATIYLRNPLYLLGLALITALGTGPEGSVASTFIMHTVGLIAFYYLQRLFLLYNHRTLIFFTLWAFGILAYYLVLVLPTMVLTNHLFGINTEIPFSELYFSIASGARFEIIATVLITTLYVGNYYAQQRLKENLLELEQRHRQLSEYAFINSHQLRAPLARLLGLANLMKLRANEKPSPELVDRFEGACLELDEVVRSITKILSDKGELNTNPHRKSRPKSDKEPDAEINNH